MKNYLLCVLSVGLCFFYEKAYAQKEFDAGAVVSMKADYYRGYVYTAENNGVPGKDVEAIKLSITPTSWGLREAGITEESFPMNSLTPTEITTRRGYVIVLNGKDLDGTEHDFRAAPLELRNGNLGLAKGYGISDRNDDEYKDKASEIKKGKRADWFLTSGKHGMDLSTSVANISSGAKVNFGTVLIDKAKIADNKPDFLFTQTAAPSNRLDEMYFVDVNGNRVGNSIFVNFQSSEIPELGSPQRYIQYDYGQGPKPLKLLSFEIKDLGIDETNYERVKGLVYIPSGSSDPAFLAADRKSIFVYRGVDATMEVNGDDIEREGDDYKVKEGNETVKVVFNGYSQNGTGPYEFTYEIITENGVKKQVTVISDSPRLEISVPTDEVGAFTYKLVKVKDTGNNKEKEIKNEEATIIIEAPICSVVPQINGVAEDTFVAISTMKNNNNPELTMRGLGAYIVLESTSKGFVITRNENPEENIKPAKEGMLVWDTTAKCLKLYSNKGGNLKWRCIKKGCNKQ